MQAEKHKKLTISMRYWLYGRKYFKAIKAMEFAKAFHIGYRKDGKTPKFDHQVRIAQYLRTLTNLLIKPEEVLCAAFLHDLSEDYDISYTEISDKFGLEVMKSVQLLTRKYRGQIVSNDIYYSAMKECPIASIVKGGDRIHNFSTMTEVFSTEKQKNYIKECEDFILPMLKQARRNFPEQEEAYENEKHMLESQIELIKKQLELKVK